MRFRFCILLAACLLPAAAPRAQEGYIGAFADIEGTECLFDYVQPSTPFDVYYVFFTPPGGATSVHFSSPLPLCLDATLVHEEPQYWCMGSLELGLDISFQGPCLTGAVHVYTATYLPISLPVSCCEFEVKAHTYDPVPGIFYYDCEEPSQRHDTRGFSAIIAGSPACPCDDPPVPVLDPEPDFTPGTTNAVTWADVIGGQVVQCATAPGFTEIVAESPWNTWNEYGFQGLVDGQTYHYRVRSENGPNLSAWSSAESSTQDASAPVSSAGPLAATQSSLTFDVPFAASDLTSGVAGVELFWARLDQISVPFGWEDGTFTVLYEHCSALIENRSGSAHSGTQFLHFSLSLATSCTAHLVWIRDLSPGDEVTAGFWRYDTHPFSDPECLVWGHWNDDPADVTVDDGDAGGNPSPGFDAGWGFLSHTWTVPAGHSGLVVEVRVSGDLGDEMDIDDLEVLAPDGATVLLPDGSLHGAPVYASCGTFTTSPVAFTAPAEGEYGFYTVATDVVGNVEEAPAEPDATTTVVLSTAVPEGPAPAAQFVLSQNTPNPFNPSTKIRYELAERARVGLYVYDVTGSVVRVLVNGVDQGAGLQEVLWRGLDDQGRRVPSGTYFYRLTAGQYEETRRMVLVR
jgi:hypothetical protein